MSEKNKRKIRVHEAEAIVQAMRSGVVPPVGLHHIQVGREREIASLIQDIERICSGGSAVRFVIGEYGAGKTFFLNVIRYIALERKLVVINADLTPERRLYSTSGHARSLYTEMMKNMSTRSRLNGGAVQPLIEQYIAQKRRQAEEENCDIRDIFYQDAKTLQEFVSGYDFAKVLIKYVEAEEKGDFNLKSSVIHWFRGEYTTATRARMDLGVMSIVEDMSYYDYLKLWAQFSRLCGYNGLLVCMDEMINLYNLSKNKSRHCNYEQILRIINDVLQGSCQYIGFLMAGTPDFLMDTRRGLYSYEALQTRLEGNIFSKGDYVDVSGPVIHLENLSQEDLFVLLCNIRHVFALGEESDYIVTDDDLHSFMEHCHMRIGDAYFHTPRSTVKAFVNFLSILKQNPKVTVSDVLGSKDIDLGEESLEKREEELTSFKL